MQTVLLNTNTSLKLVHNITPKQETKYLRVVYRKSSTLNIIN